MFIHGLFMNGWEMSYLRRRFQHAGFSAEQFRYSTTRASTQSIISSLNCLIQSLDSRKFHFVCHSMGGLIARHYLAAFGSENCLSIVTIGTPHRGSDVARRLYQFKAGRWVLGTSVQHGLVTSLPEWKGEVPLCSIAGSRGLGLGKLISPMPSENDGTVSVDETKISKMDAHYRFTGSHMGLLFSKTVADQCLDFVKSHSAGTKFG